MKPIVADVNEVDTLPGREIEFKIGNPKWVMRALSGLYSDDSMAVIREYSTNARDGMRKAGKEDEAIHVSLPTVLNPYFTVQDFGVGLDATELDELYTSFGDSGSRSEEDSNGYWGFGCKAACAYTNTFTVTTVKNGRKYVGVVTRRKDWTLVMKIVVDMATTEDNGVIIQVPVHNVEEFRTKAHDFYRYWKPGTVVVDGEYPDQAVGDKLDDGLYYSKGYQSYVVMADTPYLINNPAALFPAGMNKISFVAYVPTGAVEITPNREALAYSDYTKAALHKVIDDFVAKTIANAKKAIADAANHAEAYKVWMEWKNLIGTASAGKLTYKGDELATTFKINAMRYNRHQSRYNTHRIDEWPISSMNDTLIVTNFSPTLASHHKAKAREWLGLKSISAYYLLFTHETKVNSPWVDQNRVVDWETLKAEVPKKVRKKPDSSSVAYGRRAGSFDLWTKGGRLYEKDVPETKNLFYIGVKQSNDLTNYNVGAILNLLDMDDSVVIVPANRLKKFLRFYPHAQEFLDFLKTKVNSDGPSLMDADAHKYFSIHYNDRSHIARLDANKVDDPELAALIKICNKTENEHMAEYNKHQTLAYASGLGFKRHSYVSYQGDTPLTDNYPLLVGRNHRADKHIYPYINSIYKMRKDGLDV